MYTHPTHFVQSAHKVAVKPSERVGDVLGRCWETGGEILVRAFVHGMAQR